MHRKEDSNSSGASTSEKLGHVKPVTMPVETIKIKGPGKGSSIREASPTSPHSSSRESSKPSLSPPPQATAAVRSSSSSYHSASNYDEPGAGWSGDQPSPYPHNVEHLQPRSLVQTKSSGGSPSTYSAHTSSQPGSTSSSSEHFALRPHSGTPRSPAALSDSHAPSPVQTPRGSTQLQQKLFQQSKLTSYSTQHTPAGSPYSVVSSAKSSYLSEEKVPRESASLLTRDFREAVRVGDSESVDRVLGKEGGVEVDMVITERVSIVKEHTLGVNTYLDITASILNICMNSSRAHRNHMKCKIKFYY